MRREGRRVPYIYTVWPAGSGRARSSYSRRAATLWGAAGREVGLWVKGSQRLLVSTSIPAALVQAAQ